MALRKDTFDDEDLRRFREALEKPGALTAAINYYRATLRSFSTLRERERRRPKITAPTLVIWGENDRALGNELTVGMEPLFSGAFRPHTVPNCSHWVNEEQPDLVNRLLIDFLTDRDAS